MNAESKNVPAVKQEKTIADNVLNRVSQLEQLGEIKLPKDYSAANALRGAYLILQELRDKDNKLALEVCSKESIANSLYEMAISGLSVVKRQCSFVVYGGKLTLVREYAGTIALARRFGKVKDVTGNVIYEGDDFKYEIDPVTGKKRVLHHKPDFKNIDDSKLRGAYAIIINEDGSSEMEIMTMPQIRLAWQQGHAKGNSPAHNKFPSEMAKKTVIYRACKLKINSSDDSGLFADNDHDEIVKTSNIEIKQKGNQELVDFNHEEESQINEEVKQLVEQQEEVTEVDFEEEAKPGF